MQFWMQFCWNRVWLSAKKRGLLCPQSDPLGGSGRWLCVYGCGGCRVLGLMMVVGGLLLIGIVLIGVVWVLLVGWLLGLFYEVRVWLGTIWYGYVGMRDRPMKSKRGYFSRMHSPKTTKPTPTKILMGEDHLATTTALSRPRSFT